MGALHAPEFHDVEALAFVLDQIPVGIVFVDASGRVLWTNRRARAQLEAPGALVLRNGQLSAPSRADDEAIQRLVARVTTCPDAAPHAPETLPLSGSHSHDSRLVVVARPIERSGSHPTPGAARAVVFLSHVEQQLQASRQRLRVLFDLTPAEAELTALLASGCSLQEAAVRLAITIETARTYLKRALQKTGTRRQVELVRLVLSVATAASDET